MMRRFEVKYYLHELQAAEILRDLSTFMERDPHAALPDGSYYIRSLYFDTPEYQAFHEKIAGLEKRDKYRLRVYHDGGDAFGAILLEIKSRLNQTVAKERTGIDRDTYEAIRSGRIPATASSRAVRRFVHAARREHLRPVSLVDYRRQALRGRTDTRCRVTFDRELRSGRGRCLFQKPIHWRRPLPPNVVVMEIKVDSVLPFWLQRIIHKHQLRVSAVSKYCIGVALCARR